MYCSCSKPCSPDFSLQCFLGLLCWKRHPNVLLPPHAENVNTNYKLHTYTYWSIVKGWFWPRILTIEMRRVNMQSVVWEIKVICMCMKVRQQNAECANLITKHKISLINLFPSWFLCRYDEWWRWAPAFPFLRWNMFVYCRGVWQKASKAQTVQSIHVHPSFVANVVLLRAPQCAKEKVISWHTYRFFNFSTKNSFKK